ncbi:HAD-IC family P-type ATPase [Yimella sp. cx-573]|nr:HAD-IC family P-type ATPase [Yimella sp. cx-573]
METLGEDHRVTTTQIAGLTSAQVQERVARGEVNESQDQNSRSVADILRVNIFTRINAILAVLFALVLVTGSYRNGLFGLLIVINSGIGIAQELRAKRTLEKLTIVGQATVEVVRDGATTRIPTNEIVVDDLVELAPGDQIVVDGQVAAAFELSVDESLLTGEADAVAKHPGDALRSGSFVIAGSGSMHVTKVGADSYAAKLAAEAGAFSLAKSQLRAGIDQILKVITYLLIPAGFLTIVNQLLLAKQDWQRGLLGMVAALVPMVPEGLVLLTSVAFAVGVIRLGRRQCLVNELPAIEGLARVDVVCTDKTGTLTELGLTLDRVDQVGQEPVADALAALGAADPHPDATVQAIHEAHPDNPGWTVTAIAPFSSAKKWSGVSFEGHGNWLLGAPDILLDPESPVAEQAQQAGSQGARVLLVGTSDRAVNAAGAPGVVTAQALLIFGQRVRPDARATIEYFHRQGVQVKVISGDNAVSVGAVAASLGIGSPQTAVDARTLPEGGPEFIEAVEKGVVFGRVRPDQKKAMVDALQAKGHVVAMTGDGVNDVLALKQADVGVAMGSGSSAARAVSQIVLLNNRFATLPYVVAEGRRVIGNIERVAHLYLTKTIYAVTLALLVGLLGLSAQALHTPEVSYPFQPIHTTIAAWFTIGVPSFVLSLAPNHDRARDGFVRRVLRLTVPSGLVVAAVTLACYLLVRPDGASGASVGAGASSMSAAHQQAATACLVAMIGASWWVLVLVARPLNRWRLALVALCLLAYVPLFLLPFTQEQLLLDPSNTRSMTIGIGLAVAGMALIELLHRVVSRSIEAPERAEHP